MTTLTTWALVLFAAAAAGGLVLATFRLRNRPIPGALALAHGAAASTGLVLLTVAVVQGATGGASVALALFLVAALGGFVMVSFHLQNRPQPLWLLAVHAALAITGFVVLLAGKATGVP